MSPASPNGFNEKTSRVMQWGRQFQWLVKLNFSHFFFSTTCSPVVTQLSEHHASSSPAIRHVFAYPVSDSPVHVTGVVTDELIRSCVTPRKVHRVHEALDAEWECDRCAIRLLKQFFTKDELAMGNAEGNFNKSLLDRTRLHSLKGTSPFKISMRLPL